MMEHWVRYVGTLLLFISTSLHAQSDLYFSDSHKMFLLSGDYSVVLYNDTGATLCYYSKDYDQKTSLKKWLDYYPDFPKFIELDDLLGKFHFDTKLPAIDTNKITFQIAVTDSSEGRMKPCGQALEAEPVTMYKYITSIQYNGITIYKHSWSTHCFLHPCPFNMESHLDSFKRNTSIWTSTDGKVCYIDYSGFSIFKLASD